MYILSSLFTDDCSLHVYPIPPPPSLPSVVQFPSLPSVVQFPSLTSVVQFPSLPSVVQFPSLPSVVQFPSLPSVVQFPSLPSVVQFPSLPSVVQFPSLPSVVQFPSLPSVVQFPSLPSVVQFPSLPSVVQFPSLSPQWFNFPPPSVVQFGHRSVFPVSLVGQTTRQWWHDVLVFSVYFRPPTDRSVRTVHVLYIIRECLYSRIAMGFWHCTMCVYMYTVCTCTCTCTCMYIYMYTARVCLVALHVHACTLSSPHISRFY